MRKLFLFSPILLLGLLALLPRIELTGYAFAAQQIDTLYIHNDNADVSSTYVIATAQTSWNAFVGGSYPYRYLSAGFATHIYDTNFHFPWDTDATSAELDSVVLYFYNLEQKTGNHNVRILAHKIKSAPATVDSVTFKTGYTDSTTAVVLDSRTAFAALDSTWYRHPDIKTVIQELLANGTVKQDTISLFVRNNNSGAFVTWKYSNYGNNLHEFDTRLLVYWTPQAKEEGRGLIGGDISGGRKW